MPCLLGSQLGSQLRRQLRPRAFALAAMVAYGPFASLTHAAAPAPAPAPAAQANELQHRGTGTVKALAPDAGTVTLDHNAIKGLGWPAMTMDFTVQPQARDGLRALKVGDRVEFDVAKDKGGKFTLSRIVPIPAK